MSNRYTKASLLAGTFMAGAMIVSPAYGQTEDPNDMTDQDNAMQASPAQSDETSAAPGEEGLIVVTGSRIARRNVETAAPIAVVQDEEFKLSGTVNVENVINTLPQVVPGFTSASNNPGSGVATLNLRGLGTTRTLVLVNGRRWMFFDTTQRVDLNTIPSFLIDSVDVVTGGASAVYGSDALAGVVNFRLKNVEGVEMGGQYRITEEGDGGEYELHGAIGTSFDDGRGHATVYAAYTNRGSIFQRDREATFFALGDDGNGGLVPAGSAVVSEGALFYAGDGNLAAAPDFNVDNDGDGLPDGAVFFGAPGDFRPYNSETYNYAPANYLQIPQERYLIGGYADYEFADGHEFYTEVTYANNRVAQELAATPVSGTFSVDIASVTPFLGANEVAQLNALDASETGGADGSVDMFVLRRVVETGSRRTLDERNAFRVLGGVRGELTDWLNYDAYYMYARTRNANTQAGNISRSAFRAGLNGTADPINIFGPNTLTPAMVDQISILAQNGDISTLKVASAALSGTFGNLGMGADDIGFAVGTEYRKVSSEFIPDTALASGDVIGFNAGSPTAGSYNVKEVFAELNIPIVQDGFVNRFEITGAARYSDYSLEAVGGVWTYALGAELSPIRDITFRGQYQRAVRAPNVGELFQGQAIGFPPASDPCSDRTPVGDRTDALRQICIATGVPAAAVFTPSIQLNPQIPALFGGNPDLQEETSDSWTAGIVLQPSFIPGFVLTADYFNIKIEDAIALAGGGLAPALDLCYNQIQDVNNPLCQIFVGKRNGAGRIEVGNPPLISGANIAQLKTDGVDVEMSYSTSVPFSLMTDTGEQKLQLSFLGTYTHENSFTPIVGLDTVIECAGRFGLNCGNPTPKWKWTSRASFIDGPLTTSLRWRHLSSVRDDDDGTDYSVERLSSYDVFDLSFSFDVNEQLSLAMGIENLFDKGFDLIGSNQEQANTYPTVYDVFGRSYFASASFKF